MNLQPFYELRERLHTAANAGVNLITEDFRLQRVVSAVEPFAKASPIFAKIDQMLKQMLTPECTNRAWMLLDILALLDAVLTTQGSNGIEGELENAGCHDRYHRRNPLLPAAPHHQPHHQRSPRHQPRPAGPDPEAGGHY